MRETLPLVGKHVEEIAPVFYGRMFAAHPELLRDTFNRGNQAEGGQQKVLAASVATCATLLVAVYCHQARTLIAAGAEEERMHVELFSPNDWLLPGA